ncbi:hypothetical protein AB0O76_14480 [Streptomyces sp. NPDC086554]|uniref:hypothetical protein n=1 Tax=Streptomyces sp. NPDC086554 TaxID=3154864 RepID=UPI00342BE0E3
MSCTTSESNSAFPRGPPVADGVGGLVRLGAQARVGERHVGGQAIGAGADDGHVRPALHPSLRRDEDVLQQPVPVLRMGAVARQPTIGGYAPPRQGG